MEKEITIYDLAKELGVSPSTISRALNGHSSVNEKTKQKVLDLASKMGYRSNAFANILQKQNTNTIGVIVPRLNTLFQSSVIAGMEKVANDKGYTLIISQSMESTKKEQANAKTMFNSRVDGLLVSLAYDTENIDHFEPFFEKEIPLLFYDRIADHYLCSGIIIDNIQAAYKATLHLIEQGCRHIIHVTGNLKRNIYEDRLKGYKMALADANIPFDDANVIINKLGEAEGVEVAEKIMKMDPLPDGIFLSNDTCAVNCMKTLKMAGISIPKEIAVVGFNNDPVSRVIEPNLTTINYPGYEMGEVAVKKLINILEGLTYNVSINKIILRSELIVRESSLKNEGINRKLINRVS